MAYGDGTIYQRCEARHGCPPLAEGVRPAHECRARWFAAVEVSGPREPRRRRTFSATTREGAVARLEAYRRENPAPEHLGRAEYMRRARELGTHTEAEYWQLVRDTGGRCWYCGKKIGLWDFHGDHVVPVSRGGSDAIENIAVSCKPCNEEKGSMTGDEYRAWKAGQGR